MRSKMPLWKAALLAIATEVVLGLVPAVIVRRTHLTAEEAVPIFATHIPGLLAASPLFFIETAGNANFVGPLQLCLIVAVQVLFWGWLWRVYFAYRLRRSQGAGREQDSS